MSERVTIEIPDGLNADRWHQYDRHQKAWQVWKPSDCYTGSNLHKLATLYRDKKIGRATKPPIIAWADGRVRVQFVGNYKSAADAVAHLATLDQP